MHDNNNHTHLTSSPAPAPAPAPAPQQPTKDHLPASGEQTLQEKKTKNLQDSISNLRSQIAQLEDEVRIVGGGLREDPTTTVKRHIRLLHEYNEIKDVGQGLMGLIADARGVRVVEVQSEFGVDGRD